MVKMFYWSYIDHDVAYGFRIPFLVLSVLDFNVGRELYFNITALQFRVTSIAVNSCFKQNHQKSVYNMIRTRRVFYIHNWAFTVRGQSHLRDSGGES